MLSANNAVGGRLRLKGHAGILKRRRKKKKSVKQKESGELGQELGDNGKTGEVSELAPLEASESAGKVDEAVRTPEREEITEEPDEGAEVLMTEAEKRFKEVQEQREKERFRKLAATSYRQNVEKFNDKLASEPEHFDLFKVSHTK